VLKSFAIFSTARNAARRELDRQSAQWKRDDTLRYREELKTFSKCLEAYLGRAKVPSYRNELQDAAAALKVVVPGKSDKINALLDSLNAGNDAAVKALGNQILSDLQKSEDS